MIKVGVYSVVLFAGLIAGMPLPVLAGVVLALVVLFLPGVLLQKQRLPNEFPGSPVDQLPDDVADLIRPVRAEMQAQGFDDWASLEGPYLAVTGWWVLLRHGDGVRVATLFAVRGRRGLTGLTSVGLALAGPGGTPHLVEVTSRVLAPSSRPPTVHLFPCPGAAVPRLISQLSVAEAVVSRSLGGAGRLVLPDTPLAVLQHGHGVIAGWRIAHARGRDEGMCHRMGERDALVTGLALLPGVSHLLRRLQLRAADALHQRTPAGGT